MEKTEKKINRADFLKTGALLTAGFTPLVIGGSILASEEMGTGSSDKGIKVAWPWPYPAAGLNAETARIRAHDAYWSGKGCSYATFEAIVAGFRDTIGDPFNGLPTELMIYGHGGGAEWGSTCGTINGAAGAVCLVCTKTVSDLIIGELFGWYTQTMFPSVLANSIAVSNGYGKNTYNMNLGQSKSNSILCHVSVTNWCKETDFGVASSERKERCARMCGDVVVKAIELLNAQFVTGSFTSSYVSPALNATCLSCHGVAGIEPYAAGEMECASCHGADLYPNHLKTAIAENQQIDFEVSQNYPNPFSDRTTLKFSIVNPEYVTIEIFNLNGQKVSTLISNALYEPGQYNIDWDGFTEHGTKASSGMYIFNLRTKSATKSVRMMKL